jgi:hypothetical protein
VVKDLGIICTEEIIILIFEKLRLPPTPDHLANPSSLFFLRVFHRSRARAVRVRIPESVLCEIGGSDGRRHGPRLLLLRLTRRPSGHQQLRGRPQRFQVIWSMDYLIVCIVDY